MSVYSVSNKFLDTYDPFWICRLLSLKLGVVMILLCLCNAFLNAPQSPMLFMMFTAIGTMASEMIPASTKSKKLVNFITVIALFSMSTILFGLVSYFRFGLLVVVIVFSYLVLRFMSANPKAAAVPTLMITWGVVQLGGGAATDFTAAANNYLYFVEFALMGAITIWFFPDFNPNIFKSGFIRILEADVKNIGNPYFKNSDAAVLSALYVIHAKLPFLPDQFTTLYEAIIRFQNAFMKPHGLSVEEQLLSKSVLSELILSVNNDELYSLEGDNSQKIRECNGAVYDIFSDLVRGYNQCKA
jgi:hypothetical protein